MKDLIIKLRKSNKISQEDLAKRLGISRPTLIAIEKGERDITLGELKNISKIFDLPIEIILDEELNTDARTNAQGHTKKALNRFRNLILLCIKYGADDDGRITKTKLAKLVYLCDFAGYYHFLKPISGFEYRRLAQGPVAIQFFDIIDQDEEINVQSSGKAIMVSLNQQPDTSELNKDEEKLIKAVCTK